MAAIRQLEDDAARHGLPRLDRAIADCRLDIGHVGLQHHRAGSSVAHHDVFHEVAIGGLNPAVFRAPVDLDRAARFNGAGTAGWGDRDIAYTEVNGGTVVAQIDHDRCRDRVHICRQGVGQRLISAVIVVQRNRVIARHRGDELRAVQLR